LVGPDFYGNKQLYLQVEFTQKTGDVPGPAVARFTVTIGKLHVSESLNFTLMR